MGYAETLRHMQRHYRVVDDENQPLLQTNEWATMGFHCATGYFRPNVAAWLRVVYVVHNPANGYVKIGMTSHHDRGVYARIHEQAKGEPWKVVGLAIAVRPPRPWRRYDAVVPNLDDDLRTALVVRGVVAHVRGPTLGRDWVALTQSGPAFLRAIELECWRRGHAWLEPGFESGETESKGADVHDDYRVAPGTHVTEEMFDYEKLYGSQRFSQPLMWRTAFGYTAYGNFNYVSSGDSETQLAAPVEHDAASIDGNKTPVLAYVVMTGIERSLPFVFAVDDDGGADASQGQDRMEIQAFSFSQIGTQGKNTGMDSKDSPAQPGAKRPKPSTQDKRFAELLVVNHDNSSDIVADNDVVYVEENGSKMWDFAPVWDDFMIDFVTRLDGVRYDKLEKKINGFVGIVRELKVNEHGMLTFRLYWKNEKTSTWEWYPYEVARKMVHRIGRIQQDDVVKVDSVTGKAQQSQSLGFAQLRF